MRGTSGHSHRQSSGSLPVSPTDAYAMLGRADTENHEDTYLQGRESSLLALLVDGMPTFDSLLATPKGSRSMSTVHEPGQQDATSKRRLNQRP